MTVKVPDLEIIDSVLNKHFAQDAPINSWAEEDENGCIYIKNPNGSLYACMTADTWFELLKEEVNDEELKIT